MATPQDERDDVGTLAERDPTARGGAPVQAVADPAPLGLAGFALTTLLLSAKNAGWMGGATGPDIWLGMAIFYGGLAQFMAGMWEFRNRNTFGATAFSSFGAFWMGLGIIFFFPSVTKAALGTDPNLALSWFLFAWFVFTAYMTVASLRTTAAVAAVFVLLTLTFLFLWLGARNADAAGKGLTQVGGWLGILTAIVAFYTSFANVVNATWQRTTLPVMPLLKR
jgi:uncharacterized protein